ncbi:MAG: Fe-S cluster assembly protein HesB [Desulfurococcales archaeon ex4484_58]|nr:MAG: Fe-S cluster assembly protein HesB [Desulfurococcales archaeon ex4484_58]
MYPIVLKRIGEYLERVYGEIDLSEFIAPRIRKRELFEFIVGVMLSQNTSDRNAIKAYENLKKILGDITPEKILSSNFDEIVEAIRVAGMYRQRASRIIELARLFSKPGFVEKIVNNITNSSVEEAREILLKLPGVGAKTADVILIMYFNKPTFPVDTHITRITKRLGYLERYDYESIRRFWMKILDPRDYLKVHLLLIAHGRKTCKPRNPECSRCVIREFCKYYLSGKPRR